MNVISCDFCDKPAEGEIEYKDGEVILGCAECLLEIVADPYKPVEAIRELGEEERHHAGV